MGGLGYLAEDGRAVTVRDVVLGAGSGGDVAQRSLATLEEFILRAKGRIGLNIELKYYGWDPDLTPRLLEVVRKHDMTSRVVVILMSLNLDAVRRVRRLAPQISTGYVATVTVATADGRRLGRSVPHHPVRRMDVAVDFESIRSHRKRRKAVLEETAFRRVESDN